MRSACRGEPKPPRIRTMVQVLNRSSNEAPSDRVQRKNEARRLEILRAAARVFRRLGVSATGMREIAEEADLSPGNLYYYFSGKDEILQFCQERTLARLLDAVQAARAAAGSHAGRVRSVLAAHVQCMLDELEGATAHLEIEALPEDMRAGVIAKRDAYERAVRELVAAGVAAGEFARVDPALVTRAMLGAVNWSARWYRQDGPRSVAEIADSLSDYLVRGLLPVAKAAR
jgi:AcrR family transcriptional regulator